MNTLPGPTVSYEEVRVACCELMGRGENLSRPRVQELLLASRGSKGSNSVVQGHINEFWRDVAERMNKPHRAVADVEDEYVAIIDRALREMVEVSRKAAEKELEERVKAVEQERLDCQRTVQEAHDALAVGEQLRLKAEAERSGLQTLVGDLRASVRAQEEQLAEGYRQNSALQQLVAAKDEELRQQFVALQTASAKMEQAAESHRLEVSRLMKQVDDERQEAKRNAQALAAKVDSTRGELDECRRELSASREECVRVKADLGALRTINATQAATIADQKTKIDATNATLQTVQRELTIAVVKFETSEGHRQSVERTCHSQAEELGELRKTIETLSQQRQSTAVEDRPQLSNLSEKNGEKNASPGEAEQKRNKNQPNI